MPLSKLENFLSFESEGEGVPHSGFIRKDFSRSARLSPKMQAKLGERRILLGERDAFSLRVGVFPLKSG